MSGRGRSPAAVVLLAALAAGGSTAAAEPRALIQNLDSLHLRRDDPAAVQALRAALASATPADRQDFEVLWRAARLEVWLGDVTPEPEKKRGHGTAAADLARAAIARQPGRVEGHYYAALGIGLYCQGTGIVKILREGKDRAFTEELDKTLAIDPFFDRGGPLLAKGRYYFELPWPMRDLKKSIDHYRRILARFPYRPRARLFLADSLLKAGREAEAEAEFARLFQDDQGQDPPESRRVRELGRELDARIRKALDR